MNQQECSKQFMTAAGLLPERLWRAAFTVPPDEREKIEEFRLRIGRPFCAVGAGKRYTLADAVTRGELDELLQRATRSSIHTYMEQIRQGFITVPSGHRLGLCGETAEQNGEITNLRSFSSCNLRIARQMIGLADALCAQIYQNGFESTLILAPPGGGKTTLLRDMARVLSQSLNVALADERMEIAACRDGEPQFDVGQCDVMSGGSKSEVMTMLLRSMSPQVIALDEITGERDAEALIAASYTGCRFLTTVHADYVQELMLRPAYRQLIEQGIFQHIIEIRLRDGRRSYHMYTEGEMQCDQAVGSGAHRGVVLGGRVFHEQPVERSRCGA